MTGNYSSSEIKKYERIIHLSDIHIRMNERHEEYRLCFKNLYTKLETYDKSTSIIVITGDILNERTGLSAETIILCTEFLKNLASILKTVMIAGNHDGYLNSSQKIDIISGILYDKEISNLYYLKQSGAYTFNNITFGVSSIFENIFIKASEIETENQIKVALYHGGVGNFKLQNLMIHKGEKTITDFEGYDYVLLGDIHHHQYLNDEKTIAYASSLICQTYGEVGDHGYILWDLENKKSEYIKILNDYDFKNGYLTQNILKIDNEIFELNNKEVIEEIKEYLPKRGRLQIYRDDTLDNLEMIKYLKNKLKNISIREHDNIVIKKNEKDIQLKYEINRKDIIKELLINKYKSIDEDIVQWIEDELKNNDKSVKSEYNTCELLKLKFSNLFIYGENNEIDMLKFNAKDIILINGKNSYGKSSIIDIIIFNLYDEYARDIGNIKKSKSGILNNSKNTGSSELLIKIGETLFLIEKIYKRKKDEIDISGTIYRLDDIDDVKIVHKNHKMNSNKIYEYNDVKYKLSAYLSGKSTTKEIERLLGKKENFMLINIMMQNDNISFKNKNQSERKKILTQLLDLEKYEKIRKDVNSRFLIEKTKKDELEKSIYGIDIIKLKQDYDKNIDNLNTFNKELLEYTTNLNKTIEIKDNLMLTYTKINEDKIKEEGRIQKEIDTINTENENNKKILKDLKLLLRDKFDDDDEKYDELNKKLQEKLIEKKTLYETNYTIDNIDIEINKLKENEEMYVKLKEEYENICNEYNIKKESLSNILNVLEYEKKSIKINDKTIKSINKEEELNKLKDVKNIKKKDLEHEINKIEIELVDIEKYILELNKNIDEEQNIDDLYLINETKRREFLKYEYEMESREKLLSELEKHEYNPECDKCMKNPKVIEMFNIKNELKILKENKEKILIDESINQRKEIYENNKKELNKFYKNRNDKSSSLKILNEDKINNDKIILDIDNKIKLLQITEKINNENKNLEIDKLKTMSENINKKMKIISMKINDKKDLENEKILIIKNEEMKKSNEKCDEEIQKINISILKFKEKEMLMKTINEKEILILNNNDKNIILLKKIDEINIEKKNIEQNKIIKQNTDELDKEIKTFNKEILSLEKDKMKKELENNILEVKISNYKQTREDININQKDYRRWECYNDVLDKNGISLYIINKYLEIITIGINKIIGTIINKRIELYELSDNIIINIYDNNNNVVDFVGGMEGFILDLSLKITLAKIMELSKCNFLFIDEGISSFDKDNLTHIDELFYFLNQHFDYIFLMSHIEQIKDYVSQKIMIINENGYSKIV